MDSPRCPTCRGALEQERPASFPFCSPRCKLVDLSNWFDGRYVVSTPLAFDQQDAGVPVRDDLLYGSDE